MEEAFAWVTSNWDLIVGAVLAVHAAASAIAALTSTPKDDEALAKVYQWIDRLALNVGKAKDTGATEGAG